MKLTQFVQVEALPDVIHESPDVMPHEDMLEVIMHLVACNKKQAAEIAVVAFTARCTVVQALDRLYGKTQVKIVKTIAGL